MSRIKTCGFGLFLMMSLIFLSGCYDSREIDETGYVIALGIDKGGTEHDLRYTFQFSNPLAAGGGDEGGGAGGDSTDKSREQTDGVVWDSGNPTVTNVTIEAADYYIAGNLLHNFMSKRPNLSHIKLIVFSADLARDGILDQSRLLMQEREIRPNTHIAVARSSAEAFLKSVNPKLEVNTAKYYELLTEEDAMVYAPSIELREFVDSMTGKARSPVLPLAGVSGFKESLETVQTAFDDTQTAESVGKVYFAAGEIPRLSDVKSEMIGMTIFHDEKMIAEMNGEEAMLYRLLCGDVKTAFFSVPDLEEPEKNITFQIWMNKKPRYQVEMKDKLPQICIDMDVNANFMGAQLGDSYWDYDKLEQYAKQMLHTELSCFLEKICREYRTDILGFGSVAKRQCYTWQQWEQMNWQECYGNAEFNLNMQLKIRRGGTTLPLSIE